MGPVSSAMDAASVGSSPALPAHPSTSGHSWGQSTEGKSLSCSRDVFLSIGPTGDQ